MEQNLLSRGRGSRQTLLPRWVCPPSTNFLVRMLKRRKLSYLGSNKDTPPKQRPSLLNPVVEKKGGVPTCDAAWCLPHSGIRRGPTVNCRKSASLALSAFSAPGQAAEDAARQIVQEAAEAAEAMRREAAEWREKHRQASDRQIQAEAKAGIAAREADKLRRLLQREIGDGADLAKVMEEGSNWRGRAQQIVLLKHRLQEAQAGEAAPGTVGALFSFSFPPLSPSFRCRAGRSLGPRARPLPLLLLLSWPHRPRRRAGGSALRLWLRAAGGEAPRGREP